MHDPILSISEAQSQALVSGVFESVTEGVCAD